MNETPKETSGRAISMSLDDAEVAEAIMAGAYLSGARNLWFVSGSELTCFQEAHAKATATGAPTPALVTMMHEHVALSAAMGETMVTGRPAMTAAHADLGLLHYGGALHNALRGGYPVLIMSGYPATTRDLRQVPVFWKQQRWDQGSIVRQYVKWDHKLAPYDDPTLITSRALQVALTAPSGPAYLAVPAEVGPHVIPGNLDVVSADHLGIPRLGGGNKDQVTAIATKLLGAEAPLIVTDRIGNDPTAVELLGRICETFAIAVKASRHRMNIPDDHPSRFASWGLREADVVMVLEDHIPWIPAQEEPGAQAWVAAVGSDPAAFEIPIYEFRANERLTADPREFLLQLEEELLRLRKDRDRHSAEQRWMEIQINMRAHQKGEEQALQRDLTSTTITERALSQAVGEILEPDDILTWELARTEDCPRTQPQTLFDSGGSSLGWGVAAAAGALMADRARTAICMTGDGSYSFGSPDSLLWTQLHHDLPVLTVVFNNRGYRTGTVKLVRDYPEGYSAKGADLTGGTFDPPPDYSAEASALGGFGKKVLSRAELMPALIEARDAVVSDRRPAVLDVWLPAHVTGDHPLGKGNAAATS
ncbi:MAG: hypothetical protein GEU71_03405 [Actinobacteria bacterium]|nr:hypothetical protein [Actinomycetota bacterium]